MVTWWIGVDGEVETMTRHHPRVWPEHRLHRVLSEREHGETLLVCNNHDGWIGNVAEAAEHLTEGPWAAA